jgi:basic amino acid/polyamine antiporter, APA family
MAGTLRRSLNLPQLVFYGIGTIVGAGIYSVIGAAAGLAGGAFWLSFVLAAIAALLTVLSYAELSAMFPRAGAEYRFLHEAFPQRRWPAFLAGWLIALNAAATAATVALAFAGYLQVFVEVPRIPVALALLVLCTLVNIAGLRQSTWLAIVLTCIETGGLVLLVALGFTAGDPAQHASLPATGALEGVLGATALVFFMYIGFEDVANLAEESKQPERTMPRALLASVLIASTLYVLVAFAVLSLVDARSLSGSDAPLSFAAARGASAACCSPWLAMDGCLRHWRVFHSDARRHGWRRWPCSAAPVPCCRWAK